MRAVMLSAVPSLIALIGLSVPGTAPNEDVLAHAQERFRLGVEQQRKVADARRRFTEAAADFECLHGQGVRTPGLWLAWGNAEALAGRWPRAIWAFECGRLLDPNDAALRDHLEYAQSLVNYPPGGRGRPVSELWPRWLHRPNAGEWLVLAGVAYSLACLAGGWWYVRRRGLPLVALLLALAIAGSVGSFMDVQQIAYERDHPLLVVAVDGTALHRGNGPSYPRHPDVPNLPAGLEARLLHQRGSWMHVQLSSGETGWVPVESVMIVSNR